MSAEYWKNLDAGMYYSCFQDGKPVMGVSVSSIDATEDAAREHREAIKGALEAQDFKVSDYWPDIHTLRWLPDPEPAIPLFLPEDPSSLIDAVTQDYQERQARIQERLAKLPVTGAIGFKSVPYGWLGLSETIVEGFENACAEYPDGKIDVVQVKEKFGGLRIYMRNKGPEDFRDLAYRPVSWADAASLTRCSVTGRPGRAVGPGWILCLCQEAQHWRAKHREAFQRLIYPG